MSQRELVPLPDIDPERDGVAFSGLGFPVGFDEERLRVDTGRIQTIAKVGGLGTLYIVGAEGDTTQYSPDVVGADREGGGYAGLRMFKDDKPIVNDVYLETDEPVCVCHVKPGTIVQVNTSERDRVLREEYKGGQLNTEGQAKLLGKSMSAGIAEGARQRFEAGVKTRTKVFDTLAYGYMSLADFQQVSEGMPPIYTATLASVATAISTLQATVCSKIFSSGSVREAFISSTSGFERSLAARALARTSKFVHEAQ